MRGVGKLLKQLEVFKAPSLPNPFVKNLDELPVFKTVCSNIQDLRFQNGFQRANVNYLDS
ncbi:hypothetical protein J6590_005142 [Homalodisca vitripennis]|nr:hypothetical protein J6590_005142 [Homalodisca vitripennis]